MSAKHEPEIGEGGVEMSRGGIRRRGFLKAAAAATAAGALDPRVLVAAPDAIPAAPGATGPRAPHAAAQEEVIPLGNGEPPALQFQAYPGGTDA